MNNKERRLVGTLRRLGPTTINKTINRIFENDVLKGSAIGRGPFYYVGLNKFISKLEREGVIQHIGYDVGATNRTEKVWQVIN